MDDTCTKFELPSFIRSEVGRGPVTLKSHMTLITLAFGAVYHLLDRPTSSLLLAIVSICTKFDVSTFWPTGSEVREGVSKFKKDGHLTLTTPLCRVLHHPLDIT